MDNIKQLLLTHAEKYPLMMPTDAVKLLYQSEFGGGHLVKDKESSFKYLLSEYEKTEQNDAPLTTEIGGGFFRINISALDKNGISPDVLNDIFVASSKIKKGSLESFKKNLDILREITNEGVFIFDSAELEEYLLEYAEKGYPMVSHSESFREVYKPAYRIIDGRYIKLFDAVKRIKKLLETKERAVVAIDGRCGSGKTTVAMLLSSVFEAQTIHVDDFFLPPDLRTEERYAEPGGNVHYERFIKEVIEPLKANKDFSYGIFDCSKMQINGHKEIKNKGLIIIEGSYSLRNDFVSAYDLKFIIEIEKEIQNKRLKEREGEYYETFIEKWIPLEEAYFKKYDLEFLSASVIRI